MRAIRFATQLDFAIEYYTFEAIKRNAERMEIITRERINDELSKIMLSPRPSVGWRLLDESGLLPYVFPELIELKGVEMVEGRGHKDNFAHTLKAPTMWPNAVIMNGCAGPLCCTILASRRPNGLNRARDGRLRIIILWGRR